jgi:hypothetical protein
MKRTPLTRISRAGLRATITPRRSRLGLIVLLCTLVLGTWVGFGPSTARPRPNSAPLPSSGNLSSSPVSTSPRTKRIADVRVGDRVKADNPTGEEDLSLGAEVDPATWRKLVLRASKRDGSWADVELLRPLSWIEERGANVGGTAPVSFPECGIDGDADVLAIEPCPPIMPGRGRVVTGTFHHSSAHVMELRVDGLATPIITTVNHLFWSADRRDYVRADALSRGERLSGRSGSMVVAAAVPLNRAIPVYNLEVHGAHVYHVSTAGILVHNSATTDDCLRLAYRDPVRPPYNNGATHLDHAQARALGGSNAPSNIRPLPAETNLRKGGHEGALKAYREYLIRNGMLREDADKVIQAEIEALMKSPPPRPIDPSILDELPTNPLDQGHPW